MFYITEAGNLKIQKTTFELYNIFDMMRHGLWTAFWEEEKRNQFKYLEADFVEERRNERLKR